MVETRYRLSQQRCRTRTRPGLRDAIAYRNSNRGVSDPEKTYGLRDAIAYRNRGVSDTDKTYGLRDAISYRNRGVSDTDKTWAERRV